MRHVPFIVRSKKISMLFLLLFVMGFHSYSAHAVHMNANAAIAARKTFEVSFTDDGMPGFVLELCGDFGVVETFTFSTKVPGKYLELTLSSCFKSPQLKKIELIGFHGGSLKIKKVSKKETLVLEKISIIDISKLAKNFSGNVFSFKTAGGALTIDQLIISEDFGVIFGKDSLITVVNTQVIKP